MLVIKKVISVKIVMLVIKKSNISKNCYASNKKK